MFEYFRFDTDRHTLFLELKLTLMESFYFFLFGSSSLSGDGVTFINNKTSLLPVMDVWANPKDNYFPGIILPAEQ